MGINSADGDRGHLRHGRRDRSAIFAHALEVLNDGFMDKPLDLFAGFGNGDAARQVWDRGPVRRPPK